MHEPGEGGKTILIKLDLPKTKTRLKQRKKYR
jgi:hypothetical protein